MQFNNFLQLTFISGALFLGACSDDDTNQTAIEEPSSYTFTRNGESTVSFGGQTTRIKMATEITAQLKEPTTSLAVLDAMFDHEAGAEDFSDADLNASSKNVRSKTAASRDFFFVNVVEAAAVKEDFEGWMASQVSDVFPKWTDDAVAGQAGVLQEAGGGSKRYVNAKGLELNQAFAKGLIGALMTDQALNNYLGTAVLDEADNIGNNDAGIVAEGKNYTTMEHKWDEAYGYLYGTSADPANPNATIGEDDGFLNKYIGRVEGDDDFKGIAADIFNAFKLGRAAIVAKEYTERDAQAAIIRQKISEIIAIRAVYYLQQAKTGLEAATVDQAAVFHDLSEGFGFIYSLQFTRHPDEAGPYFTRTQVQEMLNTLMGGTNGLWDVTPTTLETLSAQIAAAFNFSVAQAGS